MSKKNFTEILSYSANKIVMLNVKRYILFSSNDWRRKIVRKSLENFVQDEVFSQQGRDGRRNVIEHITTLKKLLTFFLNIILKNLYIPTEL